MSWVDLLSRAALSLGSALQTTRKGVALLSAVRGTTMDGERATEGALIAIMVDIKARDSWNTQELVARAFIWRSRLGCTIPLWCCLPMPWCCLTSAITSCLPASSSCSLL